MEWNYKFVIYVGFVVQCSAMSISELEDFAKFLKRTSHLDETLKKGTTYDLDEDEIEATDNAWEESGKFEGDLILNEKQRRLIVQDITEGLSRNGLRDITKRWPNNELIYYIQKDHFTEDQVQAISDGIEELAQASCVKFRPYEKGDRNAVVVQGNRRGCFSNVGYQGGYQVLNLYGRHPVGRGCFRHGTVIHEFLHALGFYHMQSSPDRDEYVEIMWENIGQAARHNFRKYNAATVSDFGVGYDYGSVLHYSRRAFSNNGQDTIVPKQSGVDIGQRRGLSEKDSEKLNKMYCDADSNNHGDETSTQSPPSQKKKSTNKPFEGHGIGYHQGKTVVINLLPDEKAKTYQLSSKSDFVLFENFSKPAEDLQEREIKNNEFGRSTVDSFKPYASVDFYSDPKTESQNDKNIDIRLHNPPELPKSIFTKEAEEDNTSAIEKSLPKSSDDETTIADELSDEIDRLSKIITTHVYPSQTPDFKAYKIDSDYKTFSETMSDNKSGDYTESVIKNNPETLNSEKELEDHDVQGNVKKSHVLRTPDITKEDEASYRTSYPFKNLEHISNGSLELRTPEYATYENLKKKHETIYFNNPYINNENVEATRQHQLFGAFVPLHNNWYKNEKLNHNPADYDGDLYLDNKERNKFVTQQAGPTTNTYAYPTQNTKDYYTGSYSPQKKQAYLLFGVPVPLTRDFFRIDHQT